MNANSPEPDSPLISSDEGTPSSSGDETSSSNKPPSTHQSELESLKGRELVPYEKDEKSEGWFSRILVSLGLKSGSTLREDLHEALSSEDLAGNVFSPEERAMLQNILRLRERRVEDVMVPRAEIEAVSLNAPLTEVLQLFEETGHSRLPVYDETLDDPRGMVLIKDLLLHMTKVASQRKKPKRGRKKAEPKVEKNGSEDRMLDLSQIDLDARLEKLNVMRSVLFVPPSMLASDLMARMQATRTQMALVIDEYGGTDGLVSLEDIVEEVVGEIEDEHDEDESAAQIKRLGDGIWNVDARVELEKLTEEIGPLFDPSEHSEDMDTLGGLVFALAGHIPVRGEVIVGLPGFEFRVMDADPRRIRTVQVVQASLRDKRRKAAAAKEQAAEALI